RVYDRIGALPDVADVAALLREALLAGELLLWDGSTELTQALTLARAQVPAPPVATTLALSHVPARSAATAARAPALALPAFATVTATVTPTAEPGNVGIVIEPGGSVLLGG
ncbi:hypothetical protein V6O07_17900, partial [Arthrospira platensis SPKY2]